VSSFHRRLVDAERFELQVIRSLVARDWAAERFGQGQLTPAMRDHLKRVEPKTLVRHIPDIIAARRFASRTLVAFVDAKAGDKWRETGNHDIETDAVTAAEKWVEFTGNQCPYYFVFGDGGVLTPSVARELGRAGTFRGAGSGTPFLLVPVNACQQFDAIFGSPSLLQAAG
jgi:hypothetical protein